MAHALTLTELADGLELAACDDELIYGEDNDIANEMRARAKLITDAVALIAAQSAALALAEGALEETLAIAARNESGAYEDGARQALAATPS